MESALLPSGARPSQLTHKTPGIHPASASHQAVRRGTGCDNCGTDGVPWARTFRACGKRGGHGHQAPGTRFYLLTPPKTHTLRRFSHGARRISPSVSVGISEKPRARPACCLPRPYIYSLSCPTAPVICTLCPASCTHRHSGVASERAVSSRRESRHPSPPFLTRQSLCSVKRVAFHTYGLSFRKKTRFPALFCPRGSGVLRPGCGRFRGTAAGLRPGGGQVSGIAAGSVRQRRGRRGGLARRAGLRACPQNGTARLRRCRHPPRYRGRGRGGGG